MHKGLVHLLPHTLFNDLARFLVGEAVPEIAGEQIAVRVIPRAGLRLGKIGADAERADFPARLGKVQLKAGQLILQVGRGGKVPCAVYRRALCLAAGYFGIFGGAALFQPAVIGAAGTEAGEPDRMTPFGCMRWSAASAMRCSR